MSFDTIFDYTPVIAGINAELAKANAELVRLNDERTLLEGASAYSEDPLVVNRLVQITSEIDRCTIVIENITYVLAEIAVVTSLPPEKKLDLLYFYTVVAAQKQDFMAKVLYNHNSAMSDQKIAALRADAVTPVATKTLIAKLIYKDYKILPELLGAISLIYRFAK